MSQESFPKTTEELEYFLRENISSLAIQDQAKDDFINYVTKSFLTDDKKIYLRSIGTILSNYCETDADHELALDNAAYICNLFLEREELLSIFSSEEEPSGILRDPLLEEGFPSIDVPGRK